jgi:putative ABC transport system permease protein
MFKHLLKLLWNRKAAHGLIVAEISIAFLVVFAIASQGYHNWQLYKAPLGFSYKNALHVIIRTGGDWTETDGKTLEQALGVLSNIPNIESANAMLFGPFRGWRSISNYSYGGLDVDAIQNRISDGGAEAMGLQLIEGRWAGPEDIGLAWGTATINRRMAETLFPDESPLGKNINPPDEDNDDYRETRVVGVFEDFRQMGEFSELGNYVMRRLAVEQYEQRAFTLLIYPRPGAPVSLQEEIINTIQTIAPNWTLRIDELSSMREQRLEEVITPLSVMALVAGFLILMVGFGLFGVLWQSVTRRTNELGLRRAMGASRQRIYSQIVAEMCLTAAFGLAIGGFIAVQFPMLGTFAELDWPAAIGGITISATLVSTLCFLCALYPGWLASRRSPAEALHYE